MILHGNCLDILPMLDADSFDSAVTDPPYGLSKEPDMAEVLRHWLAGDDYEHNSKGFMGKSWDSFVPGPSIWREVYRVLKPGGHVLAFFGTRTYDMGVLAMRLAGFEIRDQVQWLYGSGFPKSHDVGKAIDKMAGVEREKSPTVAMQKKGEVGEISKNLRCAICGKARASGNPCTCPRIEDVPVTQEAAQWEGWGTALKPANEPIVVARKPLIGTVAENVLAHGVGGLNIDATRIPFASEKDEQESKAKNQHTAFGSGPMTNEIYGKFGKDRENYDPEGRWPANVIHDGSDEVLAAFPAQSSVTGKRSARSREAEVAGTNWLAANHKSTEYTDTGSPARFFYCAKSSKADRDEGLAEFAAKPSAASEFRPNHTEKAEQGEDGNPYGRWKPLKNNHPTVKPTDLMRYLCRLVTPPGGKVLDPFAGSGSTGRGAVLEGFQFTGIEMSEEYVEIARARIAAARKRYEDEVYL